MENKYPTFKQAQGQVGTDRSLCVDGQAHSYVMAGNQYYRTFRRVRGSRGFKRAAREVVQPMACSKCLKRALVPTGSGYLGMEGI